MVIGQVLRSNTTLRQLKSSAPLRSSSPTTLGAANVGVAAKGVAGLFEMSSFSVTVEPLGQCTAGMELGAGRPREVPGTGGDDEEARRRCLGTRVCGYSAAANQCRLALILGLLAPGLFLASDDARAQGSVETDRAALVALHNATDGANWRDNTNWLSDAPLSDWAGVTTDQDGRVTGLDRINGGLSGPDSAGAGRPEQRAGPVSGRRRAARVAAPKAGQPDPTPGVQAG